MKDVLKSFGIGIGILTLGLWFVSPVILQSHHVQLKAWMQFVSWLPIGAIITVFFFFVGRIILNTYRHEIAERGDK